MAQWYLGINRGQTENPGNVARGTSTNSTDFEVRIDTTKGSTREDVIKALRAIEMYMLSNFIPAGSPGTDLPPL